MSYLICPYFLCSFKPVGVACGRLRRKSLAFQPTSGASSSSQSYRQQTRYSNVNLTLAKWPIYPLLTHNRRSKAVADGAIGFYCDHHVSARMSKFMYGVEFLREFDSRDPEHISRRNRLCELPSGPKLLPDAFDCILSRVNNILPCTPVSHR